jgi:hypothetical protein
MRARADDVDNNRVARGFRLQLRCVARMIAPSPSPESNVENAAT